MKRLLSLACVMVLAALMLAACGKSEFGIIDTNDNHLTFTAKNAAKDTSVTAGTLEVAEGEKIAVAADLKDGQIRVEIYQAAEGTELKGEGDPILTGNFSKKDGESGTPVAGKYIAVATCLEKANGTIVVSVEPAE